PDDMYPYLFPKVYDGDILIYGTVDLTNFPNKAPTFNLNGEVAHCHVHGGGKGYVICFSLDSSYEWFFGSKHMQSSKFNPSVSLAYYLVAVYKFLAEDDREHEIGDDRRQRCLDFWSKNIPKEKPDVMLPYYEALSIMTELTGTKKTVDSKVVCANFGLDNIPENVLQLTDFVDKEYLLLQQEPILFCINYNKIGERHVYKVVSLDLMRESTYRSGIKKTSVGQDFNAVFPLVIHSKIYEKVKPQKILDELVKTAFSNVKTNQVIRLDDKVNVFDHYLYIVSELFNELSIDVFSESMFPCEEVLKGFVHLHHLLLVLDGQAKIGQRAEQILDFFEKDPNNRDKKMCGNLGILMTQYLTTRKKRDIGHLVDEMLARNVMWSLKKPAECKSCVGYNPGTKSFYISDMKKWIDITWRNSYIGMQRFAFQQLYNMKFSHETLESMDARFGQVDQKEIELFQQNVKELCKWKDLSGAEGYKTFMAFFGLSDNNLDERLKNAMKRSTSSGYHSFLFQKEWKGAITSVTNVKVIN
ncbi:MAG: hypothetical protein MUO21_09425, partial [Nitrososphaeraceae archaeon]|nr:hypothetical protein [Nitrososphaeraceae archaeon]